MIPERPRGRLDRALSRVLSGDSPWTSHLLLAPTSLCLGVLLLAPLLLVLAVSFTQRGPYGAFSWRSTLENYERVLDPAYFPVLLRSMSYAGLTTSLCLCIGYPVAYVLSFHAGRSRGPLLIGLMLPFWTSSLVAIYSWMILLGREGLLNGLLIHAGLLEAPIRFLNNPCAVILGLTYFYLPFMILPLYACLEKIPVATLEASQDLGAGRITTLLKITLPLSLPGMTAGIVLTFIPCAGDFLTAEFLGSAETYLMGNLIQNQFLHAQDWPFGSALAVVLLALMSAGLYAYLRVEESGSQDVSRI